MPTIVVALILGSAASVDAQGDEDGRDIGSNITYEPQPERAVIEVRSTYTITNEKPTEYG